MLIRIFAGASPRIPMCHLCHCSSAQTQRVPHTAIPLSQACSRNAFKSICVRCILPLVWITHDRAASSSRQPATPALTGAVLLDALYAHPFHSSSDFVSFTRCNSSRRPVWPLKTAAAAAVPNCACCEQVALSCPVSSHFGLTIDL